MPATQDARKYVVTSPLGKDVLLFRQLAGHEQVGTLFEFNYELLSEQDGLDADSILGQGLALSFTVLGGGTRHLHGVVTEFTQTGRSLRYSHYRAVVRPWPWFLTRTADCRVFTNLSVPDIFKQVVGAYGFSDYELNLNTTYKPLAYCMQYRETDFSFISRLFEHEGIYYYFTHQDGRHVMVLVDDPGKHKTVDGYDSVPYLPAGGNPAVSSSEYLFEWVATKQVQPGSYATNDYDFTAPRNSLAATATVSRKYARSSFEVYDYPGEIDALAGAESKRIAQVRIDELQALYMVAHGHGDALGMSPGFKFKLEGFPRDVLNIEYLVLGAQYSLSSDRYESGADADAGGQGSVAVQAIDARTTFRPPRVTPKPLVHGAQTAIVVAPDGTTNGQEINTDKYGQVQVRFRWDRNSSPVWVRVAQIWAGNGWGAMHLPRVGHEVLVEFLEGDPDRPVVTGRLYNADNMPPYALPDNATQSGILSRSSAGGSASTANELRFEDKTGSELVLLHAEKDLQVESENDAKVSIGHDRTTDVKHDSTETIGNDRTTEVKHDSKETIDNDCTITINNDCTVKVGANQNTTITKDLTTTIQGGESRSVTKDRTATISGNDSSTVSKKYALTADDQITFTCGQASITLKASGEITISGTKITLSGQQEVDISGTTQVNVSSSGGPVQVKGLQAQVEGTVKTEVSGLQLQLSGSAMAQLSGGMIMIG